MTDNRNRYMESGCLALALIVTVVVLIVVVALDVGL